MLNLSSFENIVLKPKYQEIAIGHPTHARTTGVMGEGRIKEKDTARSHLFRNASNLKKVLKASSKKGCY